jgi:hypothetical protein
MDDAMLICARLVREGAVARSELGVLDHPDVRSEVERRLAGVGLTLATSAYSEHVGIRLSPEVIGDRVFDAATNLGLKSDACALIVILWARLVLQKRTAQASHQTPGQAELLAVDRAEAAKDFTPHVRLAALVSEFGHVLGSETHVRSLVTQLRKLGFAAGRGDVVEAGPLLELGIDGERMVSFIRREVLARLLEEDAESAASRDDDPAAGLLAVLERLGGRASISDLERETHQERPPLLRLLRTLIQEGRVRRVGERSAARYERVT